jgi:hypothetical protein
VEEKVEDFMIPGVWKESSKPQKFRGLEEKLGNLENMFLCRWGNGMKPRK